jgi:antitoxin component of MazEF toxin-antitoxin module
MIKKYKIVKKVRKNGSSLAINLPQEIVELLEVKEGELLEIEIKKLK